MATQVQLRRGTSTENDAFTGAQGELTFDTTNKRVRVHDGATLGGLDLLGNFATGTGNLALGTDALGDASLSGDNNTALGSAALGANQAGFSNVALGTNALFTNVNGYQNVAIGHNAAYNISSGTTNVAIGDNALYTSSSGGGNVAIGPNALYTSTASSNVGIGANALYTSTTGSHNVAVGTTALFDNTSGASNTAIGNDALDNNTTGSFNTALGRQALFTSDTASYNTAVGYQAGYAATIGTNSTFLGSLAGATTTTSSNQTLLGHAAGRYVTGDKNTFVGANSGDAVTSGSKNTIIGRYNGNQGGLDIRTSSNYIVLSDGDGNPRQVIDSSGNLLVGTTSTALHTQSSNTGSRLLPSGAIHTAVSSDVHFMNRLSTDGDIIRFQKDGTTVGSIGTPFTGELYIQATGANSSGLLFTSGNTIQPRKNSAADDGNIDIGTGGNRFKDLYLSGGVYLGGVVSANKLDDYEEGSFTPTWDGYTPASTAGAFVRIGQLVYVSMKMVTASSSDFSGVAVNNLPFTVANETAIGGGMVWADNANFYDAPNLTQLLQNTTQCILKTINSSSTYSTREYVGRNPQIGGSTNFTWNIIYRTND